MPPLAIHYFCPWRKAIIEVWQARCNIVSRKVVAYFQKHKWIGQHGIRNAGGWGKAKLSLSAALIKSRGQSDDFVLPVID